MKRPAFPRASSATSGFFFCGSIELPVAYASARVQKPNSSVDHRAISSPIRERWTPRSAMSKRASATKSRSRDRIERVLEPVVEARAPRPRSRARAASDDPARAPAPSGETSIRSMVAISRSTSRASAQPWASRWWAKSTGWARWRWVYPGRYASPASVARPCSTSWSARTSLATPVSRRRHHKRRSVATWSFRLRPGVQLRADVAGQLGHPAFDGRVDVLVLGCEHEAALFDLLAHSLEGVEEDLDLALGQHAASAQAQHMGTRPRPGRRRPAPSRTRRSP